MKMKPRNSTIIKHIRRGKIRKLYQIRRNKKKGNNTINVTRDIWFFCLVIDALFPKTTKKLDESGKCFD